MRQDALVLHRHQHGVGHALALGDLQELHDVRLGHQDGRAADAHGRQQGDQRGVGIERRRGERDRVRAVVEGREAHRQKVAHGVAVQDALGQAGRARAVDDVEVVELADRHLERRVARRRQPVLEVAPARTREVVGDAAARDQLGQPRLVGFDQAAILVRQEQHLGIAVVEHLLQRIGRRHGRQRHDAGAGTQAAHEGLEIFDRVGGQDGDLVAAADAHGRQARGRSG